MNISKLSKLFLWLAESSLGILLGVKLVQYLILFDLMIPNSFVFKEIYTEEILGIVFLALRSLFVVSLILLPVFVFSFLIFLFTSKLKLRFKGWLFISTVILIIILPIQILFLLQDFNIVTELVKEHYNIEYVGKIILSKLQDYGSFMLIELLAILSVFYFMIFKPLDKEKPNEN